MKSLRTSRLRKSTNALSTYYIIDHHNNNVETFSLLAKSCNWNGKHLGQKELRRILTKVMHIYMTSRILGISTNYYRVSKITRDEI